ncbi:MAG: phage protein Gp36 family protein [Chthoniobacterales bacterium]
MSNWTQITPDHLKAAAHANVIDRAATMATGTLDPVAEAIADAVARVRRAVASANSLDIDQTKVPNSLKGMTVRLAVFTLMDRLGFSLKDDQRETRKNDYSDLLRLTDKMIRVETPDSSAGSGEIQQGNTVVAVNVPRRQTGRERTSGL